MDAQSPPSAHCAKMKPKYYGYECWHLFLLTLSGAKVCIDAAEEQNRSISCQHTARYIVI